MADIFQPFTEFSNHNQLLIVGACTFIGQVLRGVTGFGALIVTFLIFGILTAAGVSNDLTGGLRAAIVASVIAEWTTSFFLIAKTKPHINCQWRLVCILGVTSNACMPVGSILLKHLEQNDIQVVIGAILLCLVAIQSISQLASCGGTTRVATGNCDTHECKAITLEKQGTGFSAPLSTLPFDIEQGENATETKKEINEDSKVAIVIISPEKIKYDENLVIVSHASGRSGNQKTSTFLLFQLLICTFAGCISGIIGALTGLSGPPVLLLIQYLKLNADRARATGVVLAIIVPFPIIYVVTGVTSQNEVPLYVLAVLCGILGMFVSIAVAKCVSDKGTQTLMSLLVVVAAAINLMTGLVPSFRQTD